MDWLNGLAAAVKRLARSPGLVMAAVVSIGIGIAANATIFSMVSRFVLKPAPVADPGTLLRLHTVHGKEQCCNAFTWPLYTDLREQARSFSGVAAIHELVPASIPGYGEAERVWGQSTTANFFDVSGVGMTVGRGFRPDEERQPVVVLGQRLWKRRFAADPAILGKAVAFSGKPYTVVGVAAPGFRGLDLVLDCEFWVPLGQVDDLAPHTSNLTSRDYHWLEVVGRVKPGVTRADVEAELNGLAGRIAQSYPAAEKERGFRFEQAGSLPPRDKNAVLLFLGALSAVVLLVLAIACANVANLLMVRASGRQKELAVRSALGATRGRLMREMLAESILLALGGGLFGVLLSLWATQGLSAFRVPAPVPLDLSVSVDGRVLFYALAVSLAAGLLFGLLPALTASRQVPANALKGEDLLARPGSAWNLRNVLVTAQLAMSLVLLCATGLFLRSMLRASRIEIGFRSSGMLMISVDPRLNGYTPEKTARFLEQARERAAALPGALSAAVTDVMPLSGGNRSDLFVADAGPADGANTEMYMASRGYFETLGIPLVAGHDFGNETADGPKVAVASEALARRLFPEHNPIGRYVRDGTVRYQIIGVAGDIKSRTLGEPLRPALYRSLVQTVSSDPSLMGYTVAVRARVTPELAGALHREIRGLDPALAVYNADTIESHLRAALFLPRLAGTLFGVFGAAGLTLAAVGLYGVMSYSVSRRRSEIGLRLALGAQRAEVQRLVVKQGMLLTAIAGAIGLVAALASARFAAAFLYGLTPHDPATFLGVPLLLAGVAFLACWIPARQASSVDPWSALRHE
jgi:predicted permease